MKRRKTEYFFKGDSLICKGLPSKNYQDYQRKCLPCTDAFGWIFLCHLESCDSINFIDKKNFLTLCCLTTWNENHALMVIHYYGKPKSQYNPVTQTPDNLTQITISLGINCM